MKPQISATPAMRITSAVMLVIGALPTVGSLFADQLNLTGGGVGLGWKQLIGVVIGLVLPCSAAPGSCNRRPRAGSTAPWSDSGYDQQVQKRSP